MFATEQPIWQRAIFMENDTWNILTSCKKISNFETKFLSSQPTLSKISLGIQVFNYTSSYPAFSLPPPPCLPNLKPIVTVSLWRRKKVFLVFCNRLVTAGKINFMTARRPMQPCELYFIFYLSHLFSRLCNPRVGNPRQKRDILVYIYIWPWCFARGEDTTVRTSVRSRGGSVCQGGLAKNHCLIKVTTLKLRGRNWIPTDRMCQYAK